MALGIDLARYATDVRRLTLARRKGAALALDPDDLVQEVYRRILRRNRQACAWDSERGSLGHYVYQVAGNAIADMLTAQRRVARWELHGDPEREDEHADPADAAGALEDADAARALGISLPAAREFGEAEPPPEPLWARALRQRQAEQWAERFFARAPAATAMEQLSLLGPVASALAAPEPAEPSPPPAPAPRPRASRRPAAGPAQGSLF